MWFTLATLARAGTLVLPAEENPTDWAAALTFAGLDGSGATLILSRDRQGWWLGPLNNPHQVPVPAPLDEDSREEIAVLAASLLGQVAPDLALPGLPALLPPPSPVPSRRTPRTRPAELPATAPGVAPPEPAAVGPTFDDLPEPLVPEVLDGLIVLVDPEAPAAEVRWSGWWEVGGGGAWRQGLRAGPVVSVGGGAAFAVARVGARVSLVDRLEIPAVGAERGFSSVDVLAGGWLAPRNSATVGVLAGLSVRRGTEGTQTTFYQTMPLVGAELGGRISTLPVELLPRLRIMGDLVQTGLLVDGIDAGTLAPIQIAAEIGFSPRRRPEST